MVEYSEEEQKISRLLLKEPKTIEEIREESGISAGDVNKALKKLLKLKVVERVDSKYKLINYVVRGVMKGSKSEKSEPEKAVDSHGKYRIKMIVENASPNKEALDKSAKELEQKFKNEKFEIVNFEGSEIKKQDDNYNVFFEAEVVVPDFKDVIYLIFSYGPTFVEMLEPQKIELNVSESQEALNEVASIVNYYVSFIFQLQQKLLETQGKVQQLSK